jgi:hypothetical protein
MRIWHRALPILAILTLAAAPAVADPYAPDFELSLEGGYQRSLTTLQDFAEDSIGLGVGLGYKLNDRFVIGGDFHYTNYNLNDDLFSGFLGELQLDLAHFEYLGFAKCYLSDGRYRTYVKGGAGVFNGQSKITYQGAQGTGSSMDPGMMGSVGLQLVGSRDSATYIEFGYRRVLGDDIHWYGVSLGAAFFIW